MTKAQKKALEWLREHNGEGTFLKWPQHHVLIAAGERAPITRSTWNNLRDAGLVSIDNHRVKIL